MPIGEYSDFEDCVQKNQDKDDPEAYCAAIAKKVEGTGERSNAEELPRGTRMMNASLGIPAIVRPADGGMIIKDVILLATGTWTDSNVGTPLHYPERVLEKYAKSWVATGVWARHAGGSPRNITDKIGDVRNPRYQNIPGIGGAVIGDLHLHLLTQASRDTGSLIENGLVNYVSVEVGTLDEYNHTLKRYEAAKLEFYGVAAVDRGACEVCKIKRNEPASLHGVSKADKCAPKEVVEVETQNADKKSAEPEPKALEKSLSEAVEKLKLVENEKEVAVKRLAEFENQIADLRKKLEASEAKVAELSKAPAPMTLAAAENPKVEENLVITPRVVCRGGQVFYR